MNQANLEMIYRIVASILRTFKNKKDAIQSLELTILATKDDTSIDVQIYRQAIKYLKSL